MTVKELYEWAVAHGCEDCLIIFGTVADNYLREDMINIKTELNGEKVVDLVGEY